MSRVLKEWAPRVDGVRGVCQRDLSEFEVAYLFVDRIAERLHLGPPRQAVLACSSRCERFRPQSLWGLVVI
jgi:hypothetical protein